MLKLLGGLLITAGAGSWGLRATGQLRRRARTLAELQSGLIWLEEELVFRLTPLPELLERLGAERPGPAGLFFQDVLCGLRQDPEGGLRQSWRQAVTRRLDFLKAEDRRAVLEVGQTLGRYDAAAQRQALTLAAGRLEVLRGQAEEEARRLGRVYMALSLAAGAAVALVLV